MNDLEKAAELLDADLIWSKDMDTIRWHLAALLRAVRNDSDPTVAAYDLAEALLDDFNNDLTAG
jgi:hypothetical protein